MQKKELTIIIPHFNSSELAKKLIGSIPQKEEIQVILVDDHSTQDVSGLKQYAQEHQVEFYESDSMEHSAGHCRNLALRHAVGKWLLFADADDYFLEGFYDSLVPYFESDYDMIYFPPTSIRLCDQKKARRHIRVYHLAHDYLVSPTWENEIMLRYKWVYPVSRLIKRKLVCDNAIFFDETKVSNDVMFSMQCAVCARKIAVSNDLIYCITEQEGTLSKLEDRENVRTRLKVAVRRYKYLKKNVDKQTWRFFDLNGKILIQYIKLHQHDRRDILWAWGYLLRNGVRPCISRKVTIYNVIPKMVNKIRKKFLELFSADMKRDQKRSHGDSAS